MTASTLSILWWRGTSLSILTRAWKVRCSLTVKLPGTRRLRQGRGVEEEKMEAGPTKEEVVLLDIGRHCSQAAWCHFLTIGHSLAGDLHQRALHHFHFNVTH